MNNNEEYFNFIKLKKAIEKSELHFKGIPLYKLLSYHLARLSYLLNSVGIKSYIKLILKAFFLNYKFNRQELTGSVFVYSIERNDYKKLSGAYKDQLGFDFSDVYLGCSRKNRTVSFHPVLLINAIFSSNKITCLSLKEKFIFILSYYLSAKEYINLEKSFDITCVKNVLSFNCAYHYESFFVLMCRSKNKKIKTFSMQHGIYYKFKNKIPFDVINFKGNTSNTILCWGEFTKQQIYKSINNSTNIKIFGNPLYKNFTVPSYDAEGSKNVLVLMPRSIYCKEILTLLKLLQNDSLKGFRFVLRMHPAFNTGLITHFLGDNIIVSKLHSLQDEFSFKYLAICGFNSTSLFEAVYSGKPLLQYISQNDEFSSVGFQEFESPDQLRGVLKSTVELTRIANNNKQLSSFFFSS